MLSTRLDARLHVTLFEEIWTKTKARFIGKLVI